MPFPWVPKISTLLARSVKWISREPSAIAGVVTALALIALAPSAITAQAVDETVRYRCSDGKGIMARFLAGPPGRVSLLRDHETQLLTRKAHEGTPVYTAPDISFRVQDHRVFVRWQGLAINCVEWR